MNVNASFALFRKSYPAGQFLVQRRSKVLVNYRDNALFYAQCVKKEEECRSHVIKNYSKHVRKNSQRKTEFAADDVSVLDVPMVVANEAPLVVDFDLYATLRYPFGASQFSDKANLEIHPGGCGLFP